MVDYDDDSSSKYSQFITSVNISGTEEQNDVKVRKIGDTVAPSDGVDYIDPFRLIDAKEYESNVKLDSAKNHHPHHLETDV